MKKSKAVVGADTETTEVDFKVTRSRLAAMPIAMSASREGRPDFYTEDLDDMRQLIADINRAGLTTVWHNFKFDTKVLDNGGLPQPRLWEDTAIAGHLLNENRINKLKPLAKKLLGVDDPMTFEEADAKKILDPAVFMEYAVNDSIFARQLWEIFEPQLIQEELMTVYNLEKRMVHASLEIEENGIMMDVKKAATLRRKVNKTTERLLWDIYKKAGHQFNVRSNKQLSQVLYDELGLPIIKRSMKTGAPSCDTEVLHDLEDRSDIVAAIMEYRKMDKLASGFLNVLPKFLDENNRIHSTLNSQGARTGRTSSSNPNLQNIPVKSELGKQLRSAFIARPGYKLIIADYSQMELRILSEMLRQIGDRTMFDILRKGEDLHIKTAEAMFNKSVGKDAIERKVAKWINFGIVYGITAYGLMRRLKSEGMDLTVQECENFINIYMRTYPGIVEYMDIVERKVNQSGYIRNVYGRKRRVRGWNPRERRQAVNYTIQGSGADIVKTAMVNLYDEFHGSDVLMVGMIHDEIIHEVPAKRANKVKDIVAETMVMTPPGFKLSLPVDVVMAESWAEKG